MRQPKSLNTLNGATAANFCVKSLSLLTVTATPQVLPDRLAGNRIQFAIQVAIHQFCSFFAVHLISTYPSEPPNIP